MSQLYSTLITILDVVSIFTLCHFITVFIIFILSHSVNKERKNIIVKVAQFYFFCHKIFENDLSMFELVHCLIKHTNTVGLQWLAH